MLQFLSSWLVGDTLTTNPNCYRQKYDGTPTVLLSSNSSWTFLCLKTQDSISEVVIHHEVSKLECSRCIIVMATTHWATEKTQCACPFHVAVGMQFAGRDDYKAKVEGIFQSVSILQLLLLFKQSSWHSTSLLPWLLVVIYWLSYLEATFWLSPPQHQ